MKRFFKVLAALIFAAAYPFCCISSAYDGNLSGILWDYFVNRDTVFTYVRFVSIFVVMFILTYLNKDKLKFVSYYILSIMALLTAASFIDRFHTYRLFYNYYIVLWFAVTVGVTNAAVFICATLFSKEYYDKFFRFFWLSLSLFYLFVLYVSFIRTPDSFGRTVNTVIGNGTLKYFKYSFTHFDDTYMMLICIGNILIFLPLPFIIKSILFKQPSWISLVIGFFLPLIAEAYQYIYRCGNVDIDDLLLNWAGLILGFVLLKIVEKKKLAS